MTTPKTPKFYRQRFLLLLLDAARGRLSRMDFQKLLFLSQKEAGFSYYDFVPYHYGCYSFQAQSDLDLLESVGWLEEKPRSIRLLQKPEEILSFDDRIALDRFSIRMEGCRGDDLLVYVYEHYPYYATRSKIAKKVLDEAAYRNVQTEQDKLKRKTNALYTIGYEGRSFESYVNCLLKHDVKLLCDVRQNPLSRKFGFSKGMLKGVLPKLGIAYRHLPELGIQSDLRQELHTAEDYTRLFKNYRATLADKTELLQLLQTLVGKHERIALTCFEKEHRRCHRHCISDYLQEYGHMRVCHL